MHKELLFTHTADVGLQGHKQSMLYDQLCGCLLVGHVTETVEYIVKNCNMQ